ncbi:MAG: hypothetical protein MRJ93_13820 [Nitrososphaeraceae archaeon]|nr:hypothetical protein [Nitrososphaeraceae archaeon]
MGTNKASLTNKTLNENAYTLLLENRCFELKQIADDLGYSTFVSKWEGNVLLFCLGIHECLKRFSENTFKSEDEKKYIQFMKKMSINNSPLEVMKLQMLAYDVAEDYLSLMKQIGYS